MTSLTTLLPAPKHFKMGKMPEPDFTVLKHEDVAKVFEPPPMGHRAKFVPRTAADFGDGGAFPEIHVLQYPLNMGKKDGSGTKKVATMQMDAQGNIRYDVVLHQNRRKESHIFSKFTDLIEKDIAQEDLQRPTEEEIQEQTIKTQKALGVLVDEKIAAAQPTHVTRTNTEPTFIRYTPSQQSDSYNSGAKQRVIRLQNMQVDPLEPPKFKHRRLPTGPPSPPVPVMHSPPRKITSEDQQNWKIPPCISNWKNIKGYTIPLDKRLASDGRGLTGSQINSKFAKFSESLHIAARSARAAIDQRAQMMKNILRQQKQAKEEELRNLAAKARAMGGRQAADDDEDDSDSDSDRETEEYRGKEQSIEEKENREQLRKERQREIKRDLRQEARKAEKAEGSKHKRKGSHREEDRDISEKIALGQTKAPSKDSMFDQRLFNQSEGMSAGFGADDDYNVYSKGLSTTKKQTYIYRDKGESDLGSYGGEGEESLLEKGTKKFKADRGFDGTDLARAGSTRRKPVEFEKEVEADPFGFDKFASTVERERKTLDGVGQHAAGHMKASAGGAGKKDEYSNYDRSKTMDFEESSSSKRKSSSSRSSRDSDRRRRRRDR